MIKAILFDLDDTLLGNEMDSFMPRYFAMLSEYARPIMDEGPFIQKLIAATQTTIGNTDPQQTNADVFWDYFLAATDLDRAELELFFDRFYQTEFPRLRTATQPKPHAVELVRAGFDRGLQVVIATNPLFPRAAIEQRLAWAGVPVTEYDYALVTTYESMHATKPQPNYYREIISLVGVAPDEALMVGDDWQNDIVPAHLVGLHTFWVADEAEPLPDNTPVDGRGRLRDLHQLIHDGWLEQLTG